MVGKLPRAVFATHAKRHEIKSLDADAIATQLQRPIDGVSRSTRLQLEERGLFSH